MKNKQKVNRPLLAAIAAIFFLLSLPALKHHQLNLHFTLIFIGSFIFGIIFESIKQERKEHNK